MVYTGGSPVIKVSRLPDKIYTRIQVGYKRVAMREVH